MCVCVCVFQGEKAIFNYLISPRNPPKTLQIVQKLEFFVDAMLTAREHLQARPAHSKVFLASSF